MRLKEIEQATASAQRIDRMRANADLARARARQLNAQADTSAAQAKLQQTRKQSATGSTRAPAATIKPHS